MINMLSCSNFAINLEQGIHFIRGPKNVPKQEKQRAGWQLGILYLFSALTRCFSYTVGNSLIHAKRISPALQSFTKLGTSL